MKKRLLLLACLILSSSLLLAQYNLTANKVWAMGKNRGLDFRNGDPQVISTHFLANTAPYGGHEGSAALADTNGLVFYSNGTNVWNSLHQIMPHGFKINGPSNYTESSTQGALIVPDRSTEMSSRYYFFALTDYYKGRLFCHRIDMNLDNGLGDVDTTFYLYRVPIDSSLSEKMIAIPGCSGNIWVLVHDNTAPVFKAYEITPSGLNLTPVISTVGLGASNYSFGTMKVNPAYNKLVLCNPSPNFSLQLYDFDNSTGTVSNPYLLDSSVAMGYYSAAFSPDGTKLYAKEWYGDSITATSLASLNQFDLSSANPAATKITLGQANAALADLKLAPDGKIYFAGRIGFTNLAPYDGSEYPGRINFPNYAGTACGFQDSVTSLYFVSPSSPGLVGGLPNTVMMPVYQPSILPGTTTDSVICHFPATGILLEAGGSTGAVYLWDDGTTASSRLVTEEGLYWVRYKQPGSCTYLCDTFLFKGNLPELVIQAGNNVLSTTHAYTTYQWYKENMPIGGANSQSYMPTGSGWYSVKVTGPYGCADSAVILVNTETSIASPDDLRNYISIAPNPAGKEVYIEAPLPVSIALFRTTGQEVLRTGITQKADIRNVAEGLYFLRIYDRRGSLLKTEKLLIRRR